MTGRPTVDGASIKAWDILANSAGALKINYGERSRPSVFMINIDMKIYYCDLFDRRITRWGCHRKKLGLTNKHMYIATPYLVLRRN